MGVPRGPVGADLLGGIDGKVRRIGVYTDHGLRPLGTISDRRQVQRLVDLVLGGSLETQDPAASAKEYQLDVLTFHLADGTGVSRVFNAATGFILGQPERPARLHPDRGTARPRRWAGSSDLDTGAGGHRWAGSRCRDTARNAHDGADRILGAR